MHDQPRLEPYEHSTFFKDSRASRPTPANTVARGHLNESPHLHTGKLDSQLATTFPFPITADILHRGRTRYEIFCTPCHASTGTGDGVIVQRGMRRPPSLHIERLRLAPAGYFFDVITNGFGAMYDFSDRIPPTDRWAITAYIRALQQSQNSTLADVPPAERETLSKAE